MKHVRTALVLALTLVPAAATAQQTLRGPVENCDAVLGAETAHDLFDALRLHNPAGACSLVSMRTERDHTELIWGRDGRELPAMVLRPNECTLNAIARGPSLALEPIPDETAAQCGEATRVVRGVLGEFRGRTVPEPPHWPRWRAIVAIAVVLLTLAGSLAAYLRRAFGSASE